MSGYLRSLTETFSDRYNHYLPLPTSTPRGSVSAQGDAHSSRSDVPTSPISTLQLRGLSKKSGRRCRSLWWHFKFLIALAALSYALHAVVRHFLIPPTGSSEEAREAALSLLRQQLGPLNFSQESLSSSTSEDDTLQWQAPESVHVLFPDRSPGVASREVLPIRVYDSLSDDCIEEWVVQHRWGDACRGTDLNQGLKFDAVWAWVNGSDPAQILARHAYRPSSPINVDAAHRYADHNELLYSMRSAFESFGPDAIGKMHIMASAYPLPDQMAAGLDGTTMMAGQVPYWLNASIDGKQARIDLHHDAEYFAPMQRSSLEHALSDGDVDAWRANTIPSFNSLAVESQLFNLPRASSDQLVYLNDDFFTMVPNSVSDLTSPLFGTVIKSDTGMFSFYRPSEHPFQRLWNPAGEEVGIKRAAWILGQRFRMRTLPYITHHPRSLSLPLLKEAAQTFPDAFSNTTLARFRAQKEVPDSIQAFFLASWYIVERHREALLWTWAVAKWGGVPGELSVETKKAMWKELRSAVDASSTATTHGDQIEVSRPVRKSRDLDKGSFEKAGVPAPKNTQYSFSSQDGDALSYLDWTWPWARTRNGYPDLSEQSSGDREHSRSWVASTKSESPKVCKVSFSKCFASASEVESANSFFKRIAFKKSACGDCILAALLNASGRSGISAFLPPSSANLKVSSDFVHLDSRAHLPLTERWDETDFTLSSILPLVSQGEGKPISLRTWCTRLIQRYQYVLGSTPSTFYKVEYASRLPKQLDAVDASLHSVKPTTYLCLNDDIKESEQGTRKLNGIMKDWFASHWKTKLPGELELR